MHRFIRQLAGTNQLDGLHQLRQLDGEVMDLDGQVTVTDGRVMVLDGEVMVTDTDGVAETGGGGRGRWQ